MAHSPGPLLSAPQTDAFSPHRPLPWHPPAGPVCLVFWADRGPGASCPYGEGPRRALVTFQRWKVMRGSGGAAPQSYPQARFNISRRRRLLAEMAQRPKAVSYCPAPPDFFVPPLHFPAGCGKLNALKFVGVAKLADAADLKSADGNIVPVRSRSPAPKTRRPVALRVFSCGSVRDRG